MRPRDVHARIAALHRELAEAYEQLAELSSPPAAKRTPARPPLGPDPSPETTARVRRTLRSKGIAA